MVYKSLAMIINSNYCDRNSKVLSSLKTADITIVDAKFLFVEHFYFTRRPFIASPKTVAKT